LVEKSLLEYEALRSKLISFLGEGAAEDYHRAQDHAESCVNALHRAIEYLDRLRAKGLRRIDGSAYVPRARELAVLREDRRRAVRELRGLIEHIDNDILDGRIDPNADVTVRPMRDRLLLGGKELKYSEIAENLRLLHAIAVELTVVRLTVSERLGGGGAEV